MIKTIALFLITAIFFSCAPSFRKSLERNFNDTEVKFQDHTGFSLYDIEIGKTVFEYQANRYFTPASNTKILTFYTCLTVLGDSLPAFKYKKSTDSLIVWTMGDPTFLNSKVYNNTAAYNFLKHTENSLYLSSSNFHEEIFGKRVVLG